MDQEAFLQKCVESNEQAKVYLLNGIRLVGRVEAHDKFVIILNDGKISQMLYKHAVATVCPFAKGETLTDVREKKERRA